MTQCLTGSEQHCSKSPMRKLGERILKGRLTAPQEHVRPFGDRVETTRSVNDVQMQLASCWVCAVTAQATLATRAGRD